MSLPVDEKLIQKIYELVDEGVHQVREMERHLKIFVKNELFKDSPLPGIIIFLEKIKFPKVLQTCLVLFFLWVFSI